MMRRVREKLFFTAYLSAVIKTRNTVSTATVRVIDKGNWFILSNIATNPAVSKKPKETAGLLIFA